MYQAPVAPSESAQTAQPVYGPTPLQQPPPVVIYADTRSSQHFIIPLFIAAAISIFFTPIAGLLALCCFRGKHGIAGSLIGTGVGFLVWGIICLAAANPIRARCTDQCDTVLVSATTSGIRTSTDCGCVTSETITNVTGGGKLNPLFSSSLFLTLSEVSIGIAVLLVLAGMLQLRRTKQFATTP